METGGGFTDDRLDPKADFGGSVALGLCDIFPDADSFVGGVDGYGFGWFCSPQFLVCMGSVDGVLVVAAMTVMAVVQIVMVDRKSTRLNSSHRL